MADPAAMTTLVPHSDHKKIEGVAVAKDFLSVFCRAGGLQGITSFKLDAGMPSSLGDPADLPFDEDAYSLFGASQGPFASPLLRYGYTSMTTPSTVVDVDLGTGEKVVKKVQPVLGGFDQARYETKRVWAKAADGTPVPVSLVWNKGVVKFDGSTPLLLDGYGAYEICNDPYFSSSRLSLLDRGFVFAVAHIRGGGEMGRMWYETGKYLDKRNTVTDFITCAEHLVATQVCHPKKVCIEGRSAGGITVGASVNMRPDLFCAAIAGVPFVDVVTTMLDDSIPLTITEWEEWGNPVTSSEYYNYMKSYSPIDNVEKKGYPNMLVTAGLHDPRVAYWEPSKWVAKLRDRKTDGNLLLFKCDLGAGDGDPTFSKSGRFDKLKEIALEHTSEKSVCQAAHGAGRPASPSGALPPEGAIAPR